MMFSLPFPEFPTGRSLMSGSTRLAWFDFTRGNRIGLRVLIARLGLVGALRTALQLQWRLLTDFPFREINHGRDLTENERLSQKQMAPMVVLYRLLEEEGMSRANILELLRELSVEVGKAFLAYNVPTLSREKWQEADEGSRLRLLRGITGRFFNAQADLALEEERFSFQVNFCHFAHLAVKLGIPELAPLFCASDRYFFADFHPEVNFDRTQTLAEQGLPCDFRFTWKNQITSS